MYGNRRIACADCRFAFVARYLGGDELHISGDHPMLGDAEHEVAGRRESRVIVEGRIDGLVARET